ncbi:hypothetical protein DC20_07185 [Rufibacter tibetensis]|uniref:Uncharacterized protein n=1 Tax=Rufibacter tibetensis TaxID=512763 RepID=A0A0P0CW62_9BACT|nr:hypothetical protein DC20_07185 [Rufibacter tibetensis]
MAKSEALDGKTGTGESGKGYFPPKLPTLHGSSFQLGPTMTCSLQLQWGDSPKDHIAKIFKRLLI